MMLIIALNKISYSVDDITQTDKPFLGVPGIQLFLRLGGNLLFSDHLFTTKVRCILYVKKKKLCFFKKPRRIEAFFRTVGI